MTQKLTHPSLKKKLVRTKLLDEFSKNYTGVKVWEIFFCVTVLLKKKTLFSVSIISLKAQTEIGPKMKESLPVTIFEITCHIFFFFSPKSVQEMKCKDHTEWF